MTRLSKREIERRLDEIQPADQRDDPDVPALQRAIRRAGQLYRVDEAAFARVVHMLDGRPREQTPDEQRELAERIENIVEASDRPPGSVRPHEVS